eukprot:CAMPEP_0194354602 /NCGR_PEP_ID=MMETSP0174-20130528/2717_1 /TAXON_ID=216777 /ORGANISM="Proboscia alata, Strain PI-D3" /LENGTH=893 /DNA_ID=CAMNT_0039123605 /DNA_START=273 /DNA_END=2951 /DNA_ORIENTATION=+
MPSLPQNENSQTEFDETDAHDYSEIGELQSHSHDNRPHTPGTRSVSVDPGLMTPEELLAENGGRRKTLEKIIAKNNMLLRRGPKQQSYHERFKEHLRWFLDNAKAKISYDDFMMLVTIFILFGDDIKLIYFPASADPVFAVFYSVSFFLFIIEIVLNCWAKSDFSLGVFQTKGYMFSFFFWLDLLSIVSMVPDLKWLSSALGLTFPASNLGSQAGKTGKIGAKTSRVVRMARLVRLVKLYKVTSQRRREKKMVNDLRTLVTNGHLDEDEIEEFFNKMSDQKQSKVGAELSDIITRRVIVAVLGMLCVVPLLTYSTSIEDERVSTDFLQAANIYAGAGNSSNCDHLVGASYAFKDFMENVEGSDNRNLQYLMRLNIQPERCNISTLINFDNENFLNKIRNESKIRVETSMFVEGYNYSVSATFNLQYFVEEACRSSIHLTLFVIFMLISLSLQFTGDAQKLVLAPIEGMMEMVNSVAADPLEVLDFETISRDSLCLYETRVVQIAIQKITTLLRVGFGVAGAEIISMNMAVEGEGSACLDPMIPGKRIYAIFGFCDIHRFDWCTETLEDEIMTFINNIARIVHEEVTRWGGLCNKNLGNAFLMVWRIGDADSLQSVFGRRRISNTSRTSSSPGKAFKPLSGKSMEVDLRRIPGLDIVSDKALIGFLKVIVEINRDRQVLAYRGDKRLNIDGKFKIRMGFGLHAGWAIEGAVGSMQKVDATYLSPHVNMAARMEAASKQFGVAILMTKRFHELMSTDAQEHCRKIDVVTVKGSAVPMDILTFDTLQDQEFPELHPPKYSNLSLVDVLNQQADEYSSSIWVQDSDLTQLRRLATPIFRDIFENGMNNYLSGNWAKARVLLEKANGMMTESDTGDDGPSKSILGYMHSRDWKCPLEW